MNSSDLAKIRGFINRIFYVVREYVIYCWIWIIVFVIWSAYLYAFSFLAIPMWDGTHMNSMFFLNFGIFFLLKILRRVCLNDLKFVESDRSSSTFAGMLSVVFDECRWILIARRRIFRTSTRVYLATRVGFACFH